MDRWLNRLETISEDHPLYPCRLKVERANTHLGELEGILTDFDREKPYLIEREFNAERKELILRACVTKEPPAMTPVVFGDCIHNLRSALDYAVNALIVHSGHKPSKTTAFPIFETEHGPGGYCSRSPGMLDKLPQPVLDAIEGMQPYHGGDATVPAGHLAALQELWNTDKHRTLLLVAAAMWFDYIQHNRSGQPSSGITFRLTRAKKCAEYVAADATPQEYLDPKFTVEVHLAESGLFEGYTLVEIMVVLDDTVRQVIAQLRPFFD